ncbi:F-box/kelch-repeat protein At3g23880-like [Arachis duranensis]|uniref:F-box/kelch-repeat protein At3g23880-like n=1 Tax=Arachis duranensis TaxID=130453 RepID=A0A6P5NF84_ARADU|nr:F-box/kelch-repeat protein At3g23880-like [Arachis duranensis]
MAAVNSHNDSSTAANITNMLQSVTLTEEVFPPEIIFDILVRLPVKTLQRFRAACKLWNEMISSDRKFAKEQLRRATATVTATDGRDCNRLIKYVHSYPGEPITSFMRDYSLRSLASSSGNLAGTYSEPKGPLVEGDWMHFDGDSCHGLLLLNIETAENAMVVWNPSTGKFRTLPPVKDHPMQSCSVHTGFGYDSSTDTYKAVEVSHHRGVNIAMAHTVGTDSSWRVVPNFPGGSPRGCTKFVSGSIHWLMIQSKITEFGEYMDYYVVVSMDMGTETIEEVMVPEKIIGDLELAVLNDWLCIVGRGSMICDVWVMKEYGNAESWTKLFSIPYVETNPPSRPWYSVMDTVSDDEILLHNRISFVVYNHKNQTFSVPVLQEFRGLSDFRVYTQSLVSP